MPIPQELGSVPPNWLSCRSNRRRLGNEPLWPPQDSTISPDRVLAPSSRYWRSLKAPAVAQSAGRLPAHARVAMST